MKNYMIADGKHASHISYTVAVLSIGILSLLLLFPSFSGVSIFSKGEFIFIESVGIIFAYLALLLAVLYLVIQKAAAWNTRPSFVRYIIYASTMSLGIFLLLIVIVFTSIRSEVKGRCQEARRTYGGDCIESLVSMLDDEKQSFKSRNSAIWTLGQLADRRVLPKLKSYYTGNIPSRESLYTTISQYELKKAIQWCEVGNSTRWMYWDHGKWR